MRRILAADIVEEARTAFRASAGRVALLVCGGVAPALQALGRIQGDEPKNRKDVAASAQPVLVRLRLKGPGALTRVDYLRRGVWLASRYLAVPIAELRRT